MADAHANFAYSTIATAPSPATSGTSLVVAAADGAKFPAAPFNATVWPTSAQPTTANAEIVRVTAISADTFTFTRTQESTSARTIVTGDQIAATITAKTLTDVEQANSYLTSFDQVVAANTQTIVDDYLELAASFVYELASGAELVVGDFATPLPSPDQNTNIFVTVADETVPRNSEVVFSDFYEVAAPFASEVGVGGLLQVGTGSGTGVALPPGSISLVYRYTVVGAIKASIDTGVDTPDAGSNVWTNGDLLEVWLYCRTDEATVISGVNLTFNNDTGATQYVFGRTRNAGGGLTGFDQPGAAAVGLFCAGASVTANVFSVTRMSVPNFTGTVGAKGFEVTEGQGNSIAGNNDQTSYSGAYLSTAPLTRLAITPTTAAKNFAVGSQLLIYKRLAS